MVGWVGPECGSTGSGRAPFGKLWAGSSASSGQVFGDDGMTGMCPLCRANVSSFGANVSNFGGNVSSLAGAVSSFPGRGSVVTLAEEMAVDCDCLGL